MSDNRATVFLGVSRGRAPETTFVQILEAHTLVLKPASLEKISSG
jgi:hypothetical protein